MSFFFSLFTTTSFPLTRTPTGLVCPTEPRRANSCGERTILISTMVLIGYLVVPGMYSDQLSSQSVDCRLLQTLSVCVSVCLCVRLSVCLSVCVSVCPAFTAYISLTVGRILIKLGENVGTLVRLIVPYFIKIGLVLTLLWRYSYLLKLFLREATLLKAKQLCAKGNNFAAQDCDTSESNLLVMVDCFDASPAQLLMKILSGIQFAGIFLFSGKDAKEVF